MDPFVNRENLDEESTPEEELMSSDDDGNDEATVEDDTPTANPVQTVVSKKYDGGPVPRSAKSE